MNGYATEDTRPLLTEWARVGDTWERTLRRPYTEAQVKGRHWSLWRLDVDGRHFLDEGLSTDEEAAKVTVTAALKARAGGAA